MAEAWMGWRGSGGDGGGKVGGHHGLVKRVL